MWVCHPLLLAKLKVYGYTDDALELMTAYLLGRRRRVKLDGVYSPWRTITTGVHYMYINDLNYFISNMSLRLYGDDTTEYASDVSQFCSVLLTLTSACYQDGSD